MENAAAGNFDAGFVLELLNFHRHVVLALEHEALFELTGADDIAFAADERRRRRLEHDGKRRRIDLDRVEGDGVLGVGVDVADVGALDADDSSDVARFNDVAFLAAEVVEGKQLANRRSRLAAIVLHDEDGVTRVNRSGIHAADADASDVLGVIDRHALHGERTVGIDLGSGHVVENHVEQRVHVVVVVGGVKACEAVHGARVYHVLHRELELLVVCAEVRHQVEAVVVSLLRIGTGAVDLVHHDHDGKARLDSVTQHEARLGHGAFERVDEKQRAVSHLEHALDLAAEVGMARGVDDVDLHALVLDGDVLRQNGDAALALLVVGVEHALLDLLILAEGIGRAQKLVDEGRLAVVDVSDDGDVANVLLFHLCSFFYNLPACLRLLFDCFT